MTTRHAVTFLSALVLLIAAGCSDDARPKDDAKRASMEDHAQGALKEMKAKDPDLQSFINSGYAYAIFPEVGKGGLIVGGAHGRGTVMQGGRQVGWAEIQQASVGAQVGGQAFSELLVFENEATFNKFKNNEYTAEANASAVALNAGASKNAVFKNGVAIFTMPKGGAMLEAAVAGQRFVYTPLSGEKTTTETRTTKSETDMNRSGDTKVEVKTETK